MNDRDPQEEELMYLITAVTAVGILAMVYTIIQIIR